MIVVHILLAIFALIVYYAVGTVVCCVVCDESVSGEDDEDDHLMMAVIAMWPLVLFGFLICLPARLLVKLINKLRK